MNSLSREDVLKIVHAIRTLMEEKKQELIDLDAAMGDGDLGLTMARGFAAVDEEAQNSDETDLGKLLMRAGMTLAKVAPSTMGTLAATGFMRGGKALPGRQRLSTEDLAAFFEAFVQGLMERGKAQPGEKTIIDSVKPAADALRAAQGKDPREALSEALEAARAGVEATRQMVARHGRVAYYQEQSLGKADPGATAGMYIVQGFLGF